MEYTKWIILLACLVFADSAPFTKQPSDEHDITAILKDAVNRLFSNPLFGRRNYTYERNSEQDKVKFTLLDKRIYVEFRSSINGFTIKGQIMAFMEVFLQHYNHSFITEAFSIDGMISFIEQETVSDGRLAWSNNRTIKVEFPDVDHFEIRLLPNNYQYKANEEEEIIHEIKKLVKKLMKKNIEDNTQTQYAQLGLSNVKLMISYHLGEFLQNSKERYYSVGNIPASNYTLTNITINGLWIMQSLSSNSSDSETVVQAELGAVTGSVIQNFELQEKEPLELSFDASNIYIYENRNVAVRKIRVKITGYSVKNTKTNMLLEESESKSIMGQIESAFEASLI